MRISSTLHPDIRSPYHSFLHISHLRNLPPEAAPAALPTPQTLSPLPHQGDSNARASVFSTPATTAKSIPRSVKARIARSKAHHTAHPPRAAPSALDAGNDFRVTPDGRLLFEGETIAQKYEQAVSRHGDGKAAKIEHDNLERNRAARRAPKDKARDNVTGQHHISQPVHRGLASGVPKATKMAASNKGASA